MLDVWFSSKEDTARKELEAYQEELAELGITVEIHQAADWPTFMTILGGANRRCFASPGIPIFLTLIIFFYPLLFSQSNSTVRYIGIPRWDQLLEEARSRTDYQQRIRLYQAIEQLVLDDAPSGQSAPQCV